MIVLGNTGQSSSCSCTRLGLGEQRATSKILGQTSDQTFSDPPSYSDAINNTVLLRILKY